VKGWGTHCFIYGDGKEIVATNHGAYPEKFGRWRDFLNRISSGRLEFKLSHIRLTGSVELRSDCCSGLVLFDQSCRMDHLKLQTRWDRKWKVKFMVNKIARTINHSATNCLTQSNVQILWDYTRSVWYHFAYILHQFLISFLSVRQGGKLCLELVWFNQGCWSFLLDFLC
jgi:hypothetical protein